VSFLREKAAEWGAPPNLVIKSLCQSPPKITAELAASVVTSKTAKMLMKLPVLATI